MKKCLIYFLLIFFCFLSSCSNKYVSSYKATGMNTTQETNNCSMTFKTFEGFYVFKVKKNNSAEGNIQYSASLENGKITVYYDVAIFENKEEMFTIGSNENKSDETGYVEKGQLVYIIIESVGKCTNGTFIFNLN